MTDGRGLKGNRDFQVVLGGQAISAFGDAITLTAMPLLVLSLTGSGALMGVVGTLGLLPDLVLGLPAGALADRWDRRRMMLFADAGRAILTATIPVAYWLDLPTTAVILIVAVPLNSLRVLWAAGFTSAVPNLVGREHLGRANSLFEATGSASFIVGPVLAGVLAATIGPAPTLAVDAATFVVSAASLSFVRRPMRAQRTGAMPHLRADIRDGLRFVWGNRPLRTLIAFWSAVGIATASVLPALAYHITIDHDLSNAWFGIVGGAWSVGYLCGSLVIGRRFPSRPRAWMVGAAALIGLMLIAVAVTGSPPVYLSAAFFIGAALSVVLILYMTLRATLTPDELLGRVGSTARTISLGLQPVVLLGAGALIEATNGGTALAAMGTLAIGVAVAFSLSGGMRAAVLTSRIRC